MANYYWLPIYGAVQVGESVGWVAFVILIVAVIGVVIWYQAAQKKKRRETLLEKYKDSELVDSLISKSFWQGQTSEQRLDSLGNPEDIDQKILKTKKKEVWKYNHQGGNRYGLRITLDNDTVVGWDQKA